MSVIASPISHGRAESVGPIENPNLLKTGVFIVSHHPKNM
jgi:hypothetical protein